MIGGLAFGAEPPAKPNILLIYSDDHGWADLGAQGADKDIRTPNLDALAHDGVRFARGYVSAPQCVPSRAGVITGRYQQKFGVEDNSKGPLPLSELTIAERLKAAGYVTGQVGKWHLDLGGGKGEGEKKKKINVDFLPGKQGFDEYWCGAMRPYYASHDLGGKPFADAPHLVDDERFRVVVQTEAALSFLDRRAANPGQPWFLYLAWFAPHVPLESPEPWFSKTPENLPKERRQALAMIAAMDDGLGRIRERLRSLGMEKNTLIFFIGDNGAPLHEGAWNGSLNLPLIGEKGMLTDGGIRTPFIAAWPGMLPAGQVYDFPVSSLDVCATAVALAGLPRDAALDGVNLVPFLDGGDKAAPHESLYWRWRSQAAVLEFPWKLIRLGKNERYLFDVTTPEGELKNRIAEHPEIAARLDSKLKAWCDTLMPPGLPSEDSVPDREFFAEHVDKMLDGASDIPAKTGDAPGSVQGWQCRNGTLFLDGKGLHVTRDPGSKALPLITHAGLDLVGPVTLTIRGRTQQGGQASVAWRTKGQPDFVPENRVNLDWPASNEGRDIGVKLPVQGDLFHLRVGFPKDDNDPEIQSIELRAGDGKSQVWRFGVRE